MTPVTRAQDVLQERRATPFHAARYDAFKVCEDRTYAVGELDAGTLGEAMNAAIGKAAMFHKDHLIIRETSDQGVKLHLFAVKRKSAPRYVHKDHVTRAVYDLYAAPVCTIDGGVIGDVFNLSTRDESEPNKPLSAIK